MRRQFRHFLGLISAILMCTGIAAGQTTFGTITGIVTDPSGAVVPGAKVSITNEHEGTVRQITTGSTGVYTAPNLAVGSYRLQVSAAGFATYEASGLTLSSNQVLNADVHLALTQSGTTVEVSASGAAISTETSNISNLKTSRDLQELPLISRHGGDQGFYTYVLQNPGVNSMPGNSLNNVQGVRQQTGVLPTMDGIAVMAYPIGPGPVQPSLEGVQEVNVQLANTPAEFATPANFAVVTKSGSNEFHGSAFWDYNGSRLNARDFFSPAAPFRVYHDFGGSFGGPIRKDKTFFFGDYEGSREAANVVVTGTTPLPAWRSGDFSGLKTPIIDPLTGAQFPGNQVPASRIAPVSQKVQNFFYPLPNFGPPGLQSGNWRGQFPGQTGFTHFDDFGVRVDQNFSNGDKVYARVSYRRLPLTAREAVLPPIGQRDQLRGARSAVASWTHLFSPAVLNEFRTGFTRQRNYYYPDLVGSDILQQVGIQGVTTTGIHNVPAFNITGITTTDQPNSQALTLDTNFEWTDNLSWTRGRHAMKFGFDAIRDQLGGYNYPNSMYGTYNFNGTYTGFGYADFLLGIPQTTQLSIPTPPRYLRGTTWSLYAQDQFKVNQRLTLNYGLRYELLGPYYDRYGSIANFDPTTGAFVLPDAGVSNVNPFYPKNIPLLAASKAGFPDQALVRYPKANFYPRVGAAYKPFGDDKTVIRAGYGIYGNLVYGSLARGLGGGPFSGSTTYTNALTNGVPLFSFPYPFLPTGTTATQNAFGVNPNLSTPYTEQWNLTVERQVGSAALRLSYLGTHSAELIYARNLNQPPPSTIPFTNSRRPYPIFNTITYYDNGGNQRYNALQATIARNFGSQLTFNAGYTWAKDLTDTQEGTFSGPTIQNQFDRRAEYGNNLLTPTHRVYGYAIWHIPVGKGHRILNRGGLVEAVLGDWQMAWNAMAQSGQFFTPSFSGFDTSNTNTIGGRPDVVPGVSTAAAGTQSTNNWFNAGAFKIPGCPDSNPVCAKPDNVGRFGNAGIGTLRGPRIANADFALSKYFPIRERLRMQFRVNMANVFNHPNFALPASNISSPATVGRITSSVPATFGTVAPREIDFQLRVEF
ncbi:MAG TPA: TonB-dependent receptor [Bryobacteraceae bacterium]|nr:TonB-dependent receptor [Bryobacteraceae bacterium]